MKIQPVIMSGGSGTRLWPLSRRARPKQFLNLVTDHSLFQETVLRVSDGEKRYAAPLIIAGKDHGALVASQLDAINVAPAEIILEPCPRNTAAVAAVAAAWTAKHNPDAIVFLSPADSFIADGEAFRRAIELGGHAAVSQRIVTFGIHPTHPHTGYGYIQSGTETSASVFDVAAFKEKPDLTTAQRYLDDGRYFWNAGIFLFKAQTMLDELASHAPDIQRAAMGALDNGNKTDCGLLLNEAAFSKAPSNSIDYAVMENTDKASVVAPVDVGWSDIGSWSETASDHEAFGHLTHDCNNLTLRSDGPIIGAVGVDDLIIVATNDAVLVARRDRAQDVRALVDELKRRGREDLL